MKSKKFITSIKHLALAALLPVLAFSFYGCGSNTPESAEPPKNEPPVQTTPEEPVTPTIPDRYEGTDWAKNQTLPDADGAREKLNTLYGGAEKVFLLNQNVSRMPCPQGEIITLNMTYTVGEYTKLILEDSITEFNEVFSVINPNYKFAVNYSPTESDFTKKYSVKMSATDKLAVTETSQVFGLAH